MFATWRTIGKIKRRFLPFRSVKKMKRLNKKHLLFLIPVGILEIILLVLECLPNGVEMRFKWPDGDTGNFITQTKFYSYFSAMPYGYGNVAPMIIGILTIAIILLWFVNLFVLKRGLNVAIFTLTMIKFVLACVEFVFSKTWVNWTVFAIATMCAIYEIVKTIVNKEFSKKFGKYEYVQEDSPAESVSE